MLYDGKSLMAGGVIALGIVLVVMAASLPKVKHAPPVVEHLPCDLALTSYALTSRDAIVGDRSELIVRPITAPRPDDWEPHKYTITVNGRPFTFIERKCVS
jgi:hypothetical protein